MSTSNETDVAYVQLHEGLEESSTRSAEVLVPVLVELLRPSSVVDVGCGRGWFLAAFKAAGVAEVLGIDGDYVDTAALHVDPDEFVAADLATAVPVDRRFDVALSLEVAEHLPAASADAFVEALTTLAPTVVFSAAIPGQGGTEHINEQWPSYWIARFASRGFVVDDVVRPAIWDDDRIESWYRQNVLIFREDPSAPGDPGPAMVDVVHPETLQRIRDASLPEAVLGGASAKQLAKAMPGALKRAIAYRVAR